MTSKRKSIAINSDSSSDSDMSDSEFQVLAKKIKKSPPQENTETSSKDSGSDAKDSPRKIKQSSDVEDGEVSDSDSEMDEFDDGLDENLLGDEEDKKRLQLMSEKEREEELFKRGEKREMLKKRFEIERKLKLQRKKSKDEEKLLNKVLDNKERSRARKEAVEFNKKDKKSIAMDELKARRKEKQEQQQKKEGEMKKEESNKWKANDIYSSDSSDDNATRERSRSRSRQRHSSSSSSISSSSGSSRSRSPPINQESERLQVVRTREELSRAQLTRDQLERWCYLPNFQNIIDGCFVRVGIGQNNGMQIYRVAEVLEVVDGNKVYQLGKTRTNKSLKLRHAQQERVFRMEFVSNHSFLDEEFHKWRQEIMLGGMSMPTVSEIEHKERDIMAAASQNLSDSDINHMVKEKEKFMENPRNYAMYKSRLTKERDIAAAEGRHNEAEQLTKRLVNLEERAEHLDKQRSEKISSIALINDRNRKMNIVKAEQNIKQEIEKKRTEGEACDPFTRRKTKPKLATSVIKKLGEPSIDAPKVPSSIDIKPKGPKLIGPGGDKKDAAADSESAHDPFSAHDFDIQINLDHATPNTAIKLNLTPVGKVKQEMGPKKTLNLSDYKKKRGLI